VFMTVFHTHC